MKEKVLRLSRELLPDSTGKNGTNWSGKIPDDGGRQLLQPAAQSRASAIAMPANSGATAIFAAMLPCNTELKWRHRRPPLYRRIYSIARLTPFSCTHAPEIGDRAAKRTSAAPLTQRLIRRKLSRYALASPAPWRLSPTSLTEDVRSASRYKHARGMRKREAHNRRQRASTARTLTAKPLS